MTYDCRVELQIEYRTPVDAIEPISNSQPEDLRDAALRYLAILNAFAGRIESALVERDLKSVDINFWGAAYGLGLSCCAGVSMTERALQLGLTKAAISKQARVFIEANNLPPSYYMKQETDGYVTSRLAQVAASNGSNGAEHP